MIFHALLLPLALGAVSGARIREAKSDEFPFQVSIKTPNNRHLCGGAIITPKWILTVSECLEKFTAVRVSFGSADSNLPLNTFNSAKIVLQNELNFDKKNRLALVQLDASVSLSKTAAQAKLPTPKARLFNTTKLSGWNVDVAVDLPPSLYVTDKYFVIPKDCHSPRSQLPVPLSVDEFCGMDEDFQNGLSSPGTIVSKAGIALGILPRRPLAPSEPYIFVKLSEHGQWIKDVLEKDADFIGWVDHVTDSGNGLRATNTGLLTFFVACVMYFLV